MRRGQWRRIRCPDWRSRSRKNVALERLLNIPRYPPCLPLDCIVPGVGVEVGLGKHSVPTVCCLECLFFNKKNSKTEKEDM